MKKLHAERLLQVVRVLDELPKGKRFDLFIWHRCGTTACALGWAAADPWFTRRGLKLVGNDRDGKGRQHYIPAHKGWHDYWAARIFFAISHKDTNYLFSPDEYEDGKRSKRNVIRRIKAFVKANT